VRAFCTNPKANVHCPLILGRESTLAQDPVRSRHVGEPEALETLPGEGGTEFAVGTIIVKAGAGGELTGEPGDEVHAMVKRGSWTRSQPLA
jgi:hypothetical protein